MASRVYVDLDALDRAVLVKRIIDHGKQKEFMLWAFGLGTRKTSLFQARTQQMVTFLHRHCDEVVGEEVVL